MLEAKPEVTPDECDQVLQKLEQLDADFRKYHFAIVDLTDDDEALDTEQEALNTHDDTSHDHLRRLIAKSSASRTTESDTRRRLAKRLKHLEDNLTLLASQVDSTSAESDVCLVRQCENELNELKMELSVLARDIIDMMMKTKNSSRGNVDSAGRSSSKISTSSSCFTRVQPIVHLL